MGVSLRARLLGDQPQVLTQGNRPNTTPEPAPAVRYSRVASSRENGTRERDEEDQHWTVPYHGVQTFPLSTLSLRWALAEWEATELQGLSPVVSDRGRGLLLVDKESMIGADGLWDGGIFLLPCLYAVCMCVAIGITTLIDSLWRRELSWDLRVDYSLAAEKRDPRQGILVLVLNSRL